MGTVKLLTIFIVVACFVAVINAATSAPQNLFGIIRDQVPNTMCSNDKRRCGDAASFGGFAGTDFELTTSYSDDTYGLAGPECKGDGSNIRTCGRLTSEADPTPKYAGIDSKGNIKNAASFQKWFHNSDQTRVVNYTLPLRESQGAYVYDSDKQGNGGFFPIDGKGWKDYANNNHNYAFCMESHTRFGYTGGEIFYFSGDDDVWVYINNYLVIDLGSLHPKRTKNLDVDTVAAAIGLVKRKSYRLDFFYCERHTSESNLMLTTSLDLYCSYTDQCGICEGTGQSCCNQNSCNDNNACTEDSCDVMIKGKCVHNTITCPSSNDKCKTPACDRSTGCKFEDLQCDDGDACTVDTCASGSGCVYTTCPDIGKCQVGTCKNNPRGCEYTQRECPTNSDKCQIPTCTETNGCGFVPKDCDDGNPCTVDSCNSRTGDCIHNNTAVCNDGNLCTSDVCTPTNGRAVCTFPAKCSNDKKCLDVTCDPKVGNCVTKPVTCQTDSCHNVACSNTTGCLTSIKDCDDSNACTRDTCDTKTANGCVHTDITSSCDDGNKCTSDSCDVKSGCVNTPINLDDKNACTKDACTAAGGPTHTDISASCDDKNPCTADSCDPKSGCINTFIACDDEDPCTTDKCDSSKASGSPCVFTRIDNCVSDCKKTDGSACTSTDKCYPAICDVNGKCANTTVNCNDNNKCTDDSCNAGTCKNTPITTCTPKDFCETVSCDKAKGCLRTPVGCDDQNPCTDDLCVSGSSGYTCTHTLINSFCSICNGTSCAYSDPCNPKVCENNKCVTKNTDYVCNDNNACTAPKCTNNNGKATCSYEDVKCTQGSDLCEPNVCDTKLGCQTTPVNCTSNDLCVIGRCNSGSCIFQPVGCKTTDPCNPQVCKNGQCVSAPVVCNDGIGCTKDECRVEDGKATCVSINACPIDGCGQMDCNSTASICQTHVPDCDDGNSCTDDSYVCANNTATCVYIDSGFCNDNNSCTNDFCSSQNRSAPCSHEDIKCFPRNICEIVPATNSCLADTGCVYQEISCPGAENPCKVATCDPRAGCIVEDFICPAPSDKGCFQSFCNSSAVKGEDPCSIVKKDDWGSRQSTNGIICALRYDDTVRNAAIGTGAAVGIGIGAAAAAGFIGYGGKKGYDHWKNMQNQRFNGVQNNPLYESTQGSSENPLYRHSTTL